MTREDLYKCRKIEIEIKSARAIYDSKFSQLVSGVQRLSDMPKALNKVHDGLEELIDFYQEKITTKEKEACELIKNIESILDKMQDERYIAVIRYYYIGGLTDEETADKIGYAKNYANYLKRQAVDTFEKI